tara:strand:- start:1278 stop:1895 length:618 start_codon:yes stop_codon:yes gene_type:complete
VAKLRTLHSNNPNPKFLEEAARILNQGKLIIFPTDTVYGIGCLSNNEKGLARYEKVKGVKIEQAALSFLFQDIRELTKYVQHMNSTRFKLVKKLLPGPYALIMNSSPKLPKPFHKRKTIGVRISSHIVLQKLLPLLDAPIITSSLHNSDEILDYTTDPEVLFQEWEPNIALMLSDGYGQNIPSTVLDLTEEPFQIVREGLGEVPF